MITLAEFYARLGGSREELLKRIPTEKMILKFVNMYKADPSYGQLTAAVKVEDWQSAFRAAHALKGVALNLGFERLQAAASTLAEALRGAKPLTDPSLLEAVTREQEETMAALSALED